MSRVVFLDDAVQVDVDEVEAGCGAPVAEQPGLDVLRFQRLLQERIVVEVDLPDRQIVGRAPVRVHLAISSAVSVLACAGIVAAVSSVSVGIVLAIVGPAWFVSAE